MTVPYLRDIITTGKDALKVDSWDLRVAAKYLLHVLDGDYEPTPWAQTQIVLAVDQVAGPDGETAASWKNTAWPAVSRLPKTESFGRSRQARRVRSTPYASTRSSTAVRQHRDRDGECAHALPASYDVLRTPACQEPPWAMPATHHRSRRISHQAVAVEAAWCRGACPCRAPRSRPATSGPAADDRCGAARRWRVPPPPGRTKVRSWAAREASAARRAAVDGVPVRLGDDHGSDVRVRGRPEGPGGAGRTVHVQGGEADRGASAPRRWRSERESGKEALPKRTIRL
ncbi:hypothetical protein QQY66_25845 [Streptomyces sp. DG2A-72]|uniref:hypothetical protein n=1 Tax=Streptomyces sp. DG2A-72 TaxID=3051386 RepID=UPI00265BFD1B|nr:hypothetical protein [Streptomyces sp. DG2A-72]MDO0934925.1 hypothetical protein [Streptomyces sp. DG2A-72]